MNRKPSHIRSCQLIPQSVRRDWNHIGYAKNLSQLGRFAVDLALRLGYDTGTFHVHPRQINRLFVHLGLYHPHMESSHQHGRHNANEYCVKRFYYNNMEATEYSEMSPRPLLLVFTSPNIYQHIMLFFQFMNSCLDNSFLLKVCSLKSQLSCNLEKTNLQ